MLLLTAKMGIPHNNLWGNIENLILNESGQGMTEYGLVLSIISVSLILSVVTLREEILSMFTKVVADLTKGNELINS